MRTFVIGDIHGCFDELMELTRQIGLTDADLLISVGDIVDRGNKSKEVYEYFKNRPNSIVLIGNHERKHQNNILSYAQQIVKVQMGEAYADFVKWLEALPYIYTTADAIIVHAAFEQELSTNQQKEEVLSGSTAGERYLEKKFPANTYWTDHYTGATPIIYGHHVVGDAVKILNNTYGIDTGACHGGYLTAIELPGFTIHQVKAKQDYWKEEQRKWQVPVLQAKNWNEMPFEDIDKQLQKLAYIETPEVVEYLRNLKVWKDGLQSYEPIKAAIDNYTKALMDTHQEQFSAEANKLPIKTFLFKSKANNLTLADLQKSLNTPNKVIALKKLLQIN